MILAERSRNIRDWQREREARADAMAAVLTHLNAALGALPADAPRSIRAEADSAAHGARGHLMQVLAERNPYVS